MLIHNLLMVLFRCMQQKIMGKATQLSFIAFRVHVRLSLDDCTLDGIASSLRHNPYNLKAQTQ